MKSIGALVIILFFRIYSTGFCYNDKLNFGTSSSGLAESDIASPSPGSSLLTNPAFTFSKYRYAVSFHFANHFDIPGLNSNLATIKYYGNKYRLAAEYARFGKNDLYMESNIRLSLGFSPLKKIYLGTLLDYLHLSIGDRNGYGNYSSFGIAAGFYDGRFGFTAAISGIRVSGKNIGASEIDKLYYIAAAYHANEFTALYSCFGMRGKDRWISIGQLFKFNETVSMQLGLKSDPVTPTFGITITRNGLGIGYSYRYHPVLGDSHQAGLILQVIPIMERHASE